MKLRLAAVLLLLGLSSCAADRGRLDLPSFRHLESRAVESVDMSFGRMLIGPATWFLSDNEPETRDLKALLRGIKSVRIRSYTFDRDHAYSHDDIDKVRAQLVSKGWSRVLQSRNRDSAEDVDIYVAMDGEKTLGFALIASEPREFTILNVVGAIDVDAVQRLRKRFDHEKDSESDEEVDHDEVGWKLDIRVDEQHREVKAPARKDRQRVILAAGH
jgi:hypothetical protein